MTTAQLITVSCYVKVSSMKKVQKGGAALLIKKEIEFKQNNINTTTLESVFLELSGSIKNSKTAIEVIYRPPGSISFHSTSRLKILYRFYANRSQIYFLRETIT